MSKSYYDYVSEISSDDLYKGLLAHGLFSEKLPPFLTSEPFYQYSCMPKPSEFDGAPHTFIYFESIRNVNIPRLLGIPNPFLYQRLCQCLCKNWERIRKHFETYTSELEHKVSRIHLRKMHNKAALFEMNYDRRSWRVDKSPVPDLLIGSNYVVKADISTCFPSIYSHAIPWALVGVDEAKKTALNDRLWFNQIDKRVRNCKYGETHGLLIGPHASNLISEIILVRVDYALRKWKYIRNIDDYECYVTSYEDAQRFLLELGQELRKYDLSLNAKKTEIKPLPQASDDHWVRKLNLFVWPEEKPIKYPIIKAYMDFVISLMQSNNENSAILNYAMKVVADFLLTDNAKEYYYKTVFHLALIYPYLVPKLEEYLFEKFQIPEEAIKMIADRIYTSQLEKLNYEGVCFALYFAIKYNFRLSFDIENQKESAVESAIRSDSCIFKLLMFLYLRKFDNEASFRELERHAEDLNKNEVDLNKNWLFVYEVLSCDKLHGDWKAMKRNKVSFVLPGF